MGKLVNSYQLTRPYNTEDSHLRTHRRENLKSYMISSWSESVSNKSTKTEIHPEQFITSVYKNSSFFIRKMEIGREHVNYSINAAVKSIFG
jgi:hypothetical protein